jgi:predicted secreted acid phosphatase
MISLGAAPKPGRQNMTRANANRRLLIVAVISAWFAFVPNFAAADDCPAPPLNNIPAPPKTWPPLNIDDVKALLLAYHQQYYDLDVAAVFQSARSFVEQNATRWPRPALVLDIDETSLTNWPNILADNFGFITDGTCDALPAGPCGFNQWILKSKAKAFDPALKLFKAAKAKDVAVIFITGRRASQRDATLLNLDHEGFDGWTELRTRADRDDLPNVETFKSAERFKVEAEGYTIIANVGDQMSDLVGTPTGKCVFKVPNPFYFIP